MSEALSLELSRLFPGTSGRCRRCIDALAGVIAGVPGVLSVEITGDTLAAASRLSISVDPMRLPVAQAEAFAQHSAAAMQDRFGHFQFQLPRIGRSPASKVVCQELKWLAGVVQVDIDREGRGFIEFDRQAIDEGVLRGLVEVAGSRRAGRDADKATSSSTDAPEPLDDHGRDGDVWRSRLNRRDPQSLAGLQDTLRRIELGFALTSGAVLAGGWLVELWLPHIVPVSLYMAAYVFGGFFAGLEAIVRLRRGGVGIEGLMILAAIGAAWLGHWQEGALLLFLFSLGHALEHHAMGFARRGIDAYAHLAPASATVSRNGQEAEVAVAELSVGDIVLVRPNQRVPADGLVMAGASIVDQTAITGDEAPMRKRPARATFGVAFEKAPSDQRVYAGATNGSGTIAVRVARPAANSILARLIAVVAQAESARADTERYSERFQQIFVPCVLAAVLAFALSFLVIDEPPEVSLYRAIALLVAASPCALAVSVPSAVVAAMARAARDGVLIKGGRPLEDLGDITVLAFDKAGTLTQGRPRLTDVVPAADVHEEELLAVAVAVEACSDHPLAEAIVRDGGERLGHAPRYVATDVEHHPAWGIEADVGAVRVTVGRPELFEIGGGVRLPKAVWNDARRLENGGRTAVVVRSGSRYLGVLGLMDSTRLGARKAIQTLRALGIRRIVMMTGETPSVAYTVAKQIGVEEARGGLSSQDKAVAVEVLRREEGKIAMIAHGDDAALAMANATVKITIGAATSQAALETADVAVMARDLSPVPFVIGLSRQARAVIRQNLWFSLCVVGVLAPATILGLKIGAAVLLHEGATLLVLANALRLMAYKPSKATTN